MTTGIEKHFEDITDLLVEMKHLLGELGGFKWQMMPNGMRGWMPDGYLTDDEMKRYCEIIGCKLPKELKIE